MRFAIVLVNFHGLSDTIECLDSIAKIEHCEFETIVVDNDSGSNEAQMIADRFDWVRVLVSPTNTGWSGGNNIGIRHALRMPQLEEIPILGCETIDEPADVVFLLNNDTVVDPSILQKLESGLSQGYEILGPVINEYGDQNIVQTEGVRFNPRDSAEFFQPIQVKQTESESVTDVDIVNGCAVAIKKEVFDSIGLIDDRFFLICEESDFCLRAGKSGFRAGVLNRSLVFHKHSVSFNKAGKPLQRYYSIRNLWLLVTRHSGESCRKGAIASRLAYFRHAFHMYCHERELDNPAGAKAVAIGVADAMARRLGNQPIRASWLSWIFDQLAGCVWYIRGGRVRAARSLVAHKA